MDSKSTKKPFFSAAYYKELLRELKFIGIIFGIIQIYYGIAGEFLMPGIFSMTVNGVSMARHNDVYFLFFICCAINFIREHIDRGCWDFRYSLPIAKRTAFTAHFAATLTYAAIIFAANYVGVVIGELFRSFSTWGVDVVPCGWGEQALMMLRSLLKGISTYSGFILVFSLFGALIARLAAGAVILFLPKFFIVLVNMLRANDMSTLSVLFPVGFRGEAALEWIGIAFCAVLLSVLAYVAFSHSRAETASRAARTEWLNVLCGVLVTALGGVCVAAICTHEYDSYIGVFPYAIATALIMLAGYIIYMWIANKKLKLAVKYLPFMPIAMLIVLLAFPIAKMADKKYNKIDFTVKNIAYVRLKDKGVFPNGVSYWDGDNSVFAGESDAFDIKHTDERILSEAATLIRNGNRTGAFSDALEMMNFSDEFVEVTLKDGSKWVARDYEQPSTIAMLACENDAYLEKLVSLDRFGKGKVSYPAGLGREFEKTLREELEALSAKERLAIFERFSSTQFESEADENATYGSVIYTSIGYDHAIRVRITDALPKTRNLYMNFCNERAKAGGKLDKFVSGIEQKKYDSIFGSIEVFGGGKLLQNGYISDYEPYVDNNALIKRITELLKAGTSVENAPYILKTDLSYVNYSGGAEGMLDTPDGIFIGLSESDYAELCEIMANRIDEEWEEGLNGLADRIAAGDLKLFDENGNPIPAEKLLDRAMESEWVYDEYGFEISLYELIDKFYGMSTFD